MPPEAPFLHFLVSSTVVLGAGCAVRLARREAGALLAAAGGFLAAVAAGEAKEVHDLLSNPWGMSAADLRADSASDMAWDLCGAAAGALALLAVAAAVWALRRALRWAVRRSGAGRAATTPRTMGAPAHGGGVQSAA